MGNTKIDSVQLFYEQKYNVLKDRIVFLKQVNVLHRVNLPIPIKWTLKRSVSGHWATLAEADKLEQLYKQLSSYLTDL